MTTNALVAFFHHMAAFILFAALLCEHWLFHPNLSKEEALKLSRMDRMYGIAAGVVLIVGLLRVLYFEKGLDFYLHSTAFYFKVGLFLLVGLLSIYPTIQYISWRKKIQRGESFAVTQPVAARIILILRLELLSLLGILLAAALMARGV